MKDEINSQPVKHVIEHIKKQISERQILPGERLLLSVNYPNF